jgi:S1-C subfamily serine protease
VEGRRSIFIQSSTIPRTPVTILAADRVNDLVIMRVPLRPGALVPGLCLASSAARLGDAVFTLGYPHIDLLGTAARYTEGTISATAGLRDDPRTLQVSVPVQAGNSGGPLCTVDGRVIGIVTSKLAAEKVFQWTGDLPQNVNFAVKTICLDALLKSCGRTSAPFVPSSPPANRSDLVDRLQRSVVIVVAE